MRHDATKSLYAYWRELLPHHEEGARRWPDRSVVEPAALQAWLGDVFILHEVDGSARYRLAGTRICGLYGRELAGTPFVRAFEGDDRLTARSWVETFGREPTPLLFSTRAWNGHGEFVALETLALPLANEADPTDPRMLGITTPEARPAWLELLPVVRQEITSVRVIRPWENGLARADWPVVRPEADGKLVRLDRRAMLRGRRVAHLTVMDGGRV